MERGEARERFDERRTFEKGFLLDDGAGRMLGVAALSEGAAWLAYEVDFLTGERVWALSADSAEAARAAANARPGAWRYETTAGCDRPDCGNSTGDGSCRVGGCSKSR